ncbi:MAG: hypothetical protein SO108_06795 [Bacilli bacterium]|nr:hypothetical protein [Bacilli bacterium]
MIYLLKWWNPLTWLSDGLEKVGGAILNGIRYLMFALSTFIYGLLMDLYDMFFALCNVRLLSNDILQELSRRVGYILGVVMLFYVILGFIQLLLNPDAINDGEKGATAIIKKTIIVIVMLGSANFAFELLYQVQVTVVKSNIISKLLLPYSVTPIVNGQDTSTSQDSTLINNETFGSLLAEELFSSFYSIEEFKESDIDSNGDISSYEDCQTVVNNFRNQLINNRSFDLGYTCLNSTIVVNFKIDDSTKSDGQETNVVKFNWLLCPLVGLVAVYLMVMYCFKVGIRMVQLMFLEIISPMAIVSYLAPKKDTMFSKWKNIYISTYIDVFIRIAIINFAFFLVATVFSVTGGDGLEFQGTDFSSNPFFKVIMILSILTFAKKAPELLGKLLPESASKLGFAPSAKELFENPFVSTTVGAATGAAVGLIGGKGLGAFGGILRGASAGYKGKNIGSAVTSAAKNQAAHNIARRNGEIPGIRDKASNIFGLPTSKQNYDNQVSELEKNIENERVSTASIRRRAATYSNASSYKKKAEERAGNKLLNDHFAAGDVRKTMQENLLKHQAKIKVAERSGNANAIAQAQMEYNEKLDEYKHEYINRAILGNANGGFDDAGMNSIFDDLRNEISINADGAFDGMTLDLNRGFQGLKDFDDEITVRNSTISRDIASSDATIKGIENEIQSIKNSQGYRDSHKIK